MLWMTKLDSNTEKSVQNILLGHCSLLDCMCLPTLCTNVMEQRLLATGSPSITENFLMSSHTYLGVCVCVYVCVSVSVCA